MFGSDEGFFSWNGYRTWFKVVGSLGKAPGRLPLVICHGGPGMASDYCEPMGELSRYGRACVFYDQIGCGRSEHLPAAPREFWTMELLKTELTALIAHLGIEKDYVVLGQSCGGMLAQEHALDHPDGLRGLLLCDSMPSFPLWVQEADRLRAELPADVEATLRAHEADGTIDDPDYLAAAQVYYDRHFCRIPYPDCLVRTNTQLERDPTVYHAMNGPTEFNVIGNLKDWDVIDRLEEIKVPTLLMSGRYDEATPRIQEVMMEAIPEVEWAIFEHSGHVPHIEETEAWLERAGAFLARLDGYTTG